MPDPRGAGLQEAFQILYVRPYVRASPHATNNFFSSIQQKPTKPTKKNQKILTFSKMVTKSENCKNSEKNPKKQIL